MERSLKNWDGDEKGTPLSRNTLDKNFSITEFD